MRTLSDAIDEVANSGNRRGGLLRNRRGFAKIRRRQSSDLSVVTLSAHPKPEKFRMQEPRMERRAILWRVPSRESCKGFLRASDDRGRGRALSFSANQTRATRKENRPASPPVN
jgi:hypothetical protein